MCKEIIIISGLDRTGKSTVGNYLKSQGCIIFECGQYVREQTIDNKKTNISDYYEQNMPKLNLNITNAVNLKISTIHPTKKIIIIGVRSIRLLKLLKDLGHKTTVIYMNSNFENRYKRNMNDNKNYFYKKKELRRNDIKQYAWGLNKIKSLANIIIENNGSKTNLTQSINLRDLL